MIRTLGSGILCNEWEGFTSGQDASLGVYQALARIFLHFTNRFFYQLVLCTHLPKM